MKHTAKRTLALILAVCSLLGLMVPSVFATGEDAAASMEVGQPVLIGEPLTGELSVTEYVARYEIDGKELYFVPGKGGSLYVFDIDAYLSDAGPEYILVDEEPIGIKTPRGIVVDSQGVVYVSGDAKYLYKYNPRTKTGEEIWLDALMPKSAAFGLSVDEQDRVYVSTGAGTGDDKNARVIRYDPVSNTAAAVFASEDYSQIRSSVYHDGYVYANATTRANTKQSKLLKIDAATGAVVKETAITTDNFGGNVANLYYMSVVGGVLFGGNTTANDVQVAVDIETFERVPLGVDGMILGMVSQPVNGKSYFITSHKTSAANHLCEYDVATRTATPITGIEGTNITLRDREVYISVTQNGKTYENCLFTCSGSGAAVRVFNLETKTVENWTELTAGATSAATIRTMIGGLPGSNLIYAGGYLSPRVATYNTETKELIKKLYTNGHSQTDSMIWYDGKLYSGCYNGAYLVCYDPATGKVEELISNMKPTYKQARMHALAAGDNKIFFSTVPDTSGLGGCLGWYDLTDGSVHVVENAVDKQTIISLQYKDGLLYGSTSVHGGTGSIAQATEAKLMVYSVEKKQMLGIFSVVAGTNPNSDMVFNAAEGDIIPTYIAGISIDPATGKLWGLVSRTLFTFSFDQTAGTMTVHEELAYQSPGYTNDKNNYPSSGSMNWFPRSFIFNQGYVYVGLDSLGMFRVSTTDPVNDYSKIADTSSRCYVMGEDGNIYYMSSSELYMLPLNPVTVTEQKIDAIGTVTTESAAAIVAARKTYDALTETQKAEVTNYEKLTKAEEDFAAMSQAIGHTEQKIDAIGTVTTGSGADIAAARAAYDALTEAETVMISNYEKLTAAEAAFAQVSQFAEYEDLSVEYLFGNSKNPDVGTTALASVTFAMTKDNLWEYATGNGKASSLKFNAGTQIQMNFTSTGANWLGLRLKVLRAGTYDLSLGHDAYSSGCIGGVYLFPAGTTDNETLYAQVKAEVEQRSKETEHYVGSADYTQSGPTALGSYTFPEAGEYIIAFNMLEKTAANHGRITGLAMAGKTAVVNEKVEAVKDLIDAIGEVTLESETAITAARAAYAQLTEEQQKQIDISILAAAEQALKELKQAAADAAAAAAVDAKIAAIGKVTLESKDAIAQARADYENLTDAQKAIVSNLKDLEAAEDAYAELIKDATNPDTGDSVSVMLLAVMALVSVFALAVTSVCAKRRISK